MLELKAEKKYQYNRDGIGGLSKTSKKEIAKKSSKKKRSMFTKGKD